MLSLKRYGWLCALGAEILYGACLVYGLFLVGKTAELHHALFELLPGFVWGNVGGMILGAIETFIAAWVFAVYVVWMHNTSIVRIEK